MALAGPAVEGPLSPALRVPQPPRSDWWRQSWGEHITAQTQYRRQVPGGWGRVKWHPCCSPPQGGGLWRHPLSLLTLRAGVPRHTAPDAPKPPAVPPLPQSLALPTHTPALHPSPVWRFEPLGLQASTPRGGTTCSRPKRPLGRCCPPWGSVLPCAGRHWFRGIWPRPRGWGLREGPQQALPPGATRCRPQAGSHVP